MEELFTGNKIMLYIVSVFYILNIDKLKVKPKGNHKQTFCVKKLMIKICREELIA